MMKFTTTYNTRSRSGIGNIPKSWIESDLTDHTEIIETYFENHIRHWDFDVCGDETHDFVFDDGKAFRLEYSWWAEYHNENEEENGLKGEYFIEEITQEDANVPTRIRRDWL